MRERRFSLFLLLSLLVASSALTQEFPRNYEAPPADIGRFTVTTDAVISLVDTGWNTNTSTSDCATGWADDQWNLKLTQFRNLTVTVNDCCCPGDFFEVYVDDRLIGTTPRPATWGCSQSGSLSSGSFTVALCPGDHVIKVRDGAFDGHSPEQIQQENMCPAGFTVAGALSASSPARITTMNEARLTPTLDTSKRAAELEALVTEAQPYVYIDDRGLERLRTAEARRDGVSGEAIGLAMRLIALDNRVIAAAQRGEEVDLTAADVEFVEPLFLQIAQTDPCGTRQNPSPCPPRIESGRFFTTRDEVIRHLESSGYHRTSNYAGGSTGNDYSRVVASACGGSSFREQAIIFQRNNCWSYNLQGPEPNPEVLEYIWPRLGWPGYVNWWHRRFC